MNDIGGLVLSSEQGGFTVAVIQRVHFFSLNKVHEVVSHDMHLVEPK
jgi:hypothetical protein